MRETVVFIHGMFQNARSWQSWVRAFEDEGFRCIAESWPFHEGEPAELRSNPPADLGDLRLQTVIDKYAFDICKLDSPPIAIGHSIGGLVVQKLAELGVVKAAVPIASAPPNRMFSFEGSLVAYAVKIANPLAGNAIFKMSESEFREEFANTLSEQSAKEAYLTTATHESRNVLRDCWLEAGLIEPACVQCPLLFIGAERDRIVPSELCSRNALVYNELHGLADYQEFCNRSHFICGEPGWEEVATAVVHWLRMRLTDHDGFKF